MATFNNGQAEIYYETHGAGQPLMLIAGLSSDSQSWISILPELSKHFRIIIFDNRGCGRTKCDAGKIRIEEMVCDAIDLLDYLDIQKTHLLGHSMGGMIAQKLCLMHPERVDKLILAATSSFSTERNKLLLNDLARYWEGGMEMEFWFRNLFYWIFTEKFFESPDLVAENIKFAIEYPYPQSLEGFKEQVELICNFDMRENMGQIDKNALIVSGSQDILFPPGDVFHAFSTLKKAEFKIINRTAHSLFIENPTDFIKNIMGFLKSV